MSEDFLRKFADKMSRELGCPVSPAEAEAEAGRIIQDVARRFGRKYQFGSYEPDDIAQEAAGFALECLAKGKYDPARSLDAYLATHIKRRLHNLKRDRFMRPESPCSCCETFNPGPNPCERWVAWDRRNRAKQTLALSGSAASGGEAVASKRPKHVDEVREIDAWVDDTWPSALRADYLRMKQGVELPLERARAVRGRILGRFGELDHAD